jgi:hypothetical protein
MHWSSCVAVHALSCVAFHALVFLASAVGLSTFALSSFHAFVRQQCCTLSMHSVVPLVQYCPALVFMLHCPCIDLPALLATNRSYCCIFSFLGIGSPAVSSVHWFSCNVICTLVLLHCHPCLDSRALSSAIDSPCPAFSYLPWFSCIVIRALILL